MRERIVATTASVRLLDVPFHLDRPFTYLLPGDGTPVGVGSVVRIPFGRSDRSVFGIVTAIGEGDGDDGFGKGGSAGGWLQDGEGVFCLHPLDELLEQGEGVGSGAFRRHGEVQGEVSLGV